MEVFTLLLGAEDVIEPVADGVVQPRGAEHVKRAAVGVAPAGGTSDPLRQGAPPQKEPC